MCKRVLSAFPGRWVADSAHGAQAEGAKQQINRHKHRIKSLLSEAKRSDARFSLELELGLPTKSAGYFTRKLLCLKVLFVTRTNMIQF